MKTKKNPKSAAAAVAKAKTGALAPDAGRAAFAALAQDIDALGESELLPIRVELQGAAALAHSIGVRDIQPERRVRFEELAAARLFSLRALDQLPPLALALWHARQQQHLATGQRSHALLTPAVLNEAQAGRQRMLRVLEHYFGQDEVLASQIAIVRSGNGYRDLVNDLQVLADLYEQPRVSAIVTQDPVHYQAQDVPRARELAAQIFSHLGLDREDSADRWSATTQRAWTLLAKSYSQVRQAGAFIFADHEDTDLTYPSLVSYLRASKSRREEEPLGEAESSALPGGGSATRPLAAAADKGGSDSKQAESTVE